MLYGIYGIISPDSKVYGTNMRPIWGRQDPGGPHVGHMNLVIWEYKADAPGWFAKFSFGTLKATDHLRCFTLILGCMKYSISHIMLCYNFLFVFHTQCLINLWGRLPIYNLVYTMHNRCYVMPWQLNGLFMHVCWWHLDKVLYHIIIWPFVMSMPSANQWIQMTT